MKIEKLPDFLMFFSVGPSSVRLKYGERRWLSVGKSYLIQCEAVGSRPKAAITWWIDGKLVSETRTFFIFCTTSNQIAYSERFIVFVENVAISQNCTSNTLLLFLFRAFFLFFELPPKGQNKQFEVATVLLACIPLGVQNCDFGDCTMDNNFRLRVCCKKGTIKNLN